MQPVESIVLFWAFVVAMCIIGALAVYAHWLRPIRNYHEEDKDETNN